MHRPHTAPRVTLAPFAHKHAEQLAQAARSLAADPETAKRLWWVKQDYDTNDAHQFIASVLTDRRTGHGDAFVVQSPDNEFLGCVSAKNIDWMHGCFQGGFWLIPEARGQGIGQASLRALFGWAEDQGLLRMELLIGVNNKKSLAAAERIGCVREGVLRSRFMFNDARIDVAVMALVSDTAIQATRGPD